MGKINQSNQNELDWQRREVEEKVIEDGKKLDESFEEYLRKAEEKPDG